MQVQCIPSYWGERRRTLNSEKLGYIKFLEVHSCYESDASESDYTTNLNTKEKICEQIFSNAPAGLR